MNHCTRSMFLSSLLLGGCVLQPEVLGEGLSTDSAGVTAATQSTISAGAPLTTSDTTGAPEPGDYGAPCELVGVADPVQTKAVSLQPDCAGDVCVFMFDDLPPPCSDDSDCADPWPTCGDGHCVLDPGFVAESTVCTQTCEEDADCPPIPGCESGAACAPVTGYGPLCCEKICLCQDDFNVGTVHDLESMCQQPGACGP